MIVSLRTLPSIPEMQINIVIPNMVSNYFSTLWSIRWEGLPQSQITSRRRDEKPKLIIQSIKNEEKMG